MHHLVGASMHESAGRRVSGADSNDAARAVGASAGLEPTTAASLLTTLLEMLQEHQHKSAAPAPGTASVDPPLPDPLPRASAAQSLDSAASTQFRPSPPLRRSSDVGARGLGKSRILVSPEASRPVDLSNVSGDLRLLLRRRQSAREANLLRNRKR